MFPFRNFKRALKKFKPLYLAINKFFTAYTLESALLVISQYKRCPILTIEESKYVGLDQFIVEIYLVPQFYEPLHVAKPTVQELSNELDQRAFLRHQVLTDQVHRELLRRFCSPHYLVHFLNKYKYHILEDETWPDWETLTYRGGHWVPVANLT